ncbi:hypothetical protein V7S43_001931 [Phytophthora oleae]|uniref:Uncharacterized protein n=1 Tax=Phytophthora oleae TaxID=2107226 RepID=A0ABD3G1V1_9STRA
MPGTVPYMTGMLEAAPTQTASQCVYRDSIDAGPDLGPKYAGARVSAEVQECNQANQLFRNSSVLEVYPLCGRTAATLRDLADPVWSVALLLPQHSEQPNLANPILHMLCCAAAPFASRRLSRNEPSATMIVKQKLGVQAA